VDYSGLYCDHTVLCALRAADIRAWKSGDDAAIERSNRYSLKLLQGLLASRLVSAFCYLRLTGEGVRIGGGFHTYPSTIRQLPVFSRDNATKGQEQRLADIEESAGRMLDLHRQLAAVKTSHDKTVLKRQIAATDRQIDRLVYELYGLTAEEIAIVEESAQQS
jgi:hypothetical protein